MKWGKQLLWTTGWGLLIGFTAAGLVKWSMASIIVVCLFLWVTGLGEMSANARARVAELKLSMTRDELREVRDDAVRQGREA